ncbi:MarR family winged helix-turn-helix transcriptional regulator [Nesterenkonia massiliensis]|uniref:MarR family winged helix-turn-helix transcriptional regulator n=1 Tax=Nesterenkonia massiliensis TaxID=1232429 RepID=UPI0005CA1C8E|nr:MarR family transcriptional regulator [Nesterenkonia massiliensis]
MCSSDADELIKRYFDERLALLRLRGSSRVEPFLDMELTIQQLRIVLLVASGAASTASRLAMVLGVSKATISVAVDQLVKQGHLQQSESPTDRRVKELTPTTETLQLFDLVMDRRDTSTELLASLDSADLAALVQGMSALRRALQERSEPQ